MERQHEHYSGRADFVPKPDDVRWVQRMALAIAGRRAAADDLVQEAWLVALDANVELSDEKRGWWFGTMRNLQRRQRRSDERRSDRERKRDQPRVAAPSAEEVCLRAEAQQRIAGAALRLEEPLRSTLLLRFFDGVPVPDIARQQGVRVDSVRARIRRAIKLLQADLDRGDDPGWDHDFALALPLGFSLKALSDGALAGSSSGAAVLSIFGGSLMLGKVALALTVSAALAVTAWLTLWSPSGDIGVSQTSVLPENGVSVLAQNQGPGELRSQVVPSGPRSALPTSTAPSSLDSSSAPPASRSQMRVSIVLPDGTKRMDASGSFVVSEATVDGWSDVGFSTRVDFSLGEFTATLPDSVELCVHDFVVNAPGPVRRSMEPIAWKFPSSGISSWDRDDAAGTPEWVVPVEPIATLHVSDRENADPLDALVVMIGPKAWDLPPYLGEGERDSVVTARGASPLEIPLRDFASEEVDLWVGGEGRGWASCTVPGSVDSSTALTLAEGGELELRFGTPLPDGCGVELLRRDHPQKIMVDNGDDWHGRLDLGAQQVMTGVVPGLYDVLVEFAPPHAEWPLTRELARAKVKVRAGERTVVDLEGVTLGEEESRTDVSIELAVSPDWNIKECFLRLSPLQAGWDIKRRQWTEEDLEFDSEGVVVVEALDLAVGTYLLEFFAINHLAHTALVEVSADEPVLSFPVPRPTELRLWVVDEGTGANLDVTRLAVGPPTPRGAQGRITPMTVPERSANGSIVLIVPGGHQRLSLQVEDERRAERTLDITQNPTEIVVEIPD